MATVSKVRVQTEPAALRISDGAADLSPGRMPDAATSASPAPIGGGHVSEPKYWLVNAAFLQEIKDSNPHLWHEVHALRTLCQLDSDDWETPQGTIKTFVHSLDELRDLLALQFALEESYGLIDGGPMPRGGNTGSTSGPQSMLSETEMEQQRLIVQVTDQHRCLYLQLIDLVEQAEELQYRGCDANCLRAFASRVERFSNDLTAHERLEATLIDQIQI